MSKIMKSLLVGALVFGLTACSSSKPEADTPNTEPQATQTTEQNTTTTTPEGLNPLTTVFIPNTLPGEAYATIKIYNDNVELMEDAWLGLVPAGKDYVTELEADEVDIIWFGLEPREENDPYVFACDFSDVEDGTYALVVASSDDADVGKIVIQLGFTKDGNKIDFDYTNAKLVSK